MPDARAPLYARVQRRVPRLARDMIDRFVAEVPLYAELPVEQLEGEILSVTAANLRLFFDVLGDGGVVRPEQTAQIRTSAARRAEERIPLDAVLAAYHVGARVAWDALVEAAGPDDHGTLLEAGGLVLRYVQQVTAAVAAAYLDEQQLIAGAERDQRRALASALLSGRPAAALAVRAGVHLAPAHLVLAVRIGPHPDELPDAGEGVGAAVAARRKLRRVQAALEDWAGSRAVLGLLEPDGGQALVGLPDPAVTPGELVPELAQRLVEAAGCDVLVAGALAGAAVDVPAAGEQARDVLALAERSGQARGAVVLRDVLLEYQLSRPSQAVRELARLLEPLDRNPDLPLTLETYLSHDCDRRRTAAALHVHPNTLDYRLRRIVTLTGLDPATTHGLQTLGAAVAARRFAGVGED